MTRKHLSSLSALATLLTCLVCGLSAQITTHTAYNVRAGASLPATCNAGPPITDVYSLTSGTSGLYICSAANTWTYLGGGSGAPVTTSGLTTGYIPKATGTAAVGNSACDDGHTTAGVVTCTEPIAPTQVNLGSSPSTTGVINLSNNTGIYEANSTGNAVPLVSLNSSNALTVGNGNANSVTLGNSTTVSGSLAATGLSSSTSALNYACYNSSSGAFTYDSSGTCLASSLRFKDVRAELGVWSALARVLQYRTVDARYKPSINSVADHAWHPMMVAENVAKVAPGDVEYGTDGKVRAIRDNSIQAEAVAAIQAQQYEICMLGVAAFVMLVMLIWQEKRRAKRD